MREVTSEQSERVWRQLSAPKNNNRDSNESKSRIALRDIQYTSHEGAALSTSSKRHQSILVVEAMVGCTHVQYSTVRACESDVVEIVLGGLHFSGILLCAITVHESRSCNQRRIRICVMSARKMG